MPFSQILMWAIASSVLACCYHDVRRNFFPKLRAEPPFQHLTIAVCIAVFLLWSAEAGILPGLNIHFLATTALTLMFGWRVAFVLCWPITLILVINDSLSFEFVGQYLVLSCLVPILISYGIFLISYRYLPRNIFVYIFVAAFFSGALAGTSQLLATGLFHYFYGLHDWQQIIDNYLIFTLLLAFPEGMLNGMAIAILVVFKPEWLRTFSDRAYLYNHNSNK